MYLSLFSASISSSVHLSSKSKSVMVWLLIILTVTFGLSAELVSGQTKKRSGVRRSGVVKPSVPTATADVDDRLPLDPAIVAESRRLEQRRLEEQQRIERELLAKNNSAQTPQEDLWRGYRQTFPFHSQVIALSEAAADGSRTLVVSEPPPYVTLEDILSTVGDLLLNHQVKKHRIGYDGWVKDVVIAIKGDDELIESMLGRLNQRLFFTSYKSYTLRLPVRIRARSLDLNLSVTPAELNQWVVIDGEQFFPVEGGAAETLASLSKEQSSGVYVSRRRGLVGWWIPKKRNLQECRVPARQFTLDADLIVGAIANKSGVFVMGRERSVPVDILPPLRFETLALLADVQQGQNGSLAQSYERTHPYAGRIGEGKDWAPILLSPELRDTEYGSLLNITDQLLKGWSNSGETKYENFPYPPPSRYPFPKPLWEQFGIGAETQALTYNWNTKGVGFTVTVGPVTYLALNRSGALPVSYIPEGTGQVETSVVSAEESGYDYFSNLGDPNLARVVQYAAAYQIFSAFDVARSAKEIPADNYPDQLLESLTAELDSSLRQASDVELDRIAQQLTGPILSSLDELIRSVTAPQMEDLKKRIHEELRRNGFQPGTKEYVEKFDSVFDEVKKEQRRLIERRVGSDIKEQLTLTKLNLPAKDAFGKEIRGFALSQLAYLRQMPQRYAQAIDRRATGWIHTPVVVISWNKDGTFVGGHNLDARVSKIKVDESSLPGQVQIDRSGTLVVNPRDLDRVRGLARNVERNDLFRELAVAINERDPAKVALVQRKIDSALSSADATPILPRETALQLPPPPNKPPTNKPPISNGEPSGAGGAGWGGDGRLSIPVVTEGKQQDSVIRIKARDNRFDVEVSSGEGARAYVVKGLTHEDAVDLAALQAGRSTQRGKQIIVEFEGLSDQRAAHTLESIQIQMGLGSAPELIGRLASGDHIPLTELMLSKFDSSRARVEIAEIKTLSSGDIQQDVSLTVPALENGAQSLTFKSELKFNKLTPRNVISAVSENVSKVLTSLSKRWSRVEGRIRFDATVENYHKDLARSLKRIKTKTKLDFGVKTTISPDSSGGPQQRRDIYIGKKDLSNAGPEVAADAYEPEGLCAGGSDTADT